MPMPSRFPVRALPLLLLSLSFLAACAEEKQSAPQQRAPVVVETAPVEPAAFEETVRGIGSVKAGKRVVIRPERFGIIEEIHFQEGQEVDRGRLLVTLRDDKLQQELAGVRSELRSAQATLEQTRRSHERFSRLFAQDTISREELDQVETEYETAQAEVSRLEARIGLIREQLEDTRIRAPMAGVLSESLFDPGDYVEGGEELVTLYDTSTMEVAFRVSGSRSRAVEAGQPVRVTVDAHPDREFPGRVVFVGPSIDPATRTFLVKARMENPSGLLTPGAFATVEVVVNERSGQPSVPEESLVPVRTGYVVFTVDDNKTAHRQGVQTGLREPGLVEITQGLSLGDRVVTRGHMNLSDGDSVQIESTTNSTAPGQDMGSEQGQATRQ